METLFLSSWEDHDFKTNQFEAIIMQNWYLNPSMQQTQFTPSPNSPSSPTIFSPPPFGFSKLNFDGVVKGNPRLVGIRGVFKNSSGIYLYYCNIGHKSNNVAGLAALSSRLQSTVCRSLFPLEVEGDFHLIISLARNIQCRVSVNKLSLSWRISICLSELFS